MIDTNIYILIIYYILLKLVNSEACFEKVCEPSVNCYDRNVETLFINCTNKRNIVIIHIEHNNLQKLNKGMFEGLTSLEELRAEENNISYIDKDTFVNLKQLILLQLNDNSLEYINESTFGTVHNLTLLDLKYNRIKVIERGSFNGLNSLTNLRLEHNFIERISVDAFSETSKLYHFSCQNNLISDVTFVKKLKTLTNLDISNNIIENIQTDLLLNHTNLVTLYCNGNKIHDVSFIQHLTHLTNLSLNHNLIKVVVVHIFNKLKTLSHLDLSFNNIEKIKSGTFSELKKLEFLDLSHNNLIKFGNVHLLSLKTLLLKNNRLSNIGIQSDVSFNLHVDNNTWDCDFVQKLFNIQNAHLKYTNDTSDTHMKGLPCEDGANPSTIKEDTNDNIHIIYLIAGFIILVLIVVVVIVCIYLKILNNRFQRLHGSIVTTRYGSHYEGAVENIYDVPNERYTTQCEGSRYMTPTLVPPHEYIDIVSCCPQNPGIATY